MKKNSLFVFSISIAITIFFLAGIAQAQDKMATPAEAKQLLKTIVAHVKEVGCGKSIPEFNNTKGTFNATYKNAYVDVSDLSGNSLANGRYPFIVGKNHMDTKDAEGKQFVRIGLENLKKVGHSQMEYKWFDSKTKKIETRTMISEIIDCGAPRGKVSFAVTYEGKM